MSDARGPRVAITYCTMCQWLLRAGWMAQELLSTFGTELGEVTLVPGTGGVFVITVDDDVVWDRKVDEGFPDAAELKRRVRDRINPARPLGHADRTAPATPAASPSGMPHDFPLLPEGTRWSLEIQDARDASAAPLVSRHADLVLPTASIGKLVLLVEAARRIEDGTLDPAEPLTRTREDWVADSGLWHLLATEALPVADVCGLVGAVSDNLATNVLLRRLGLDAVTATASALGMERSTLLDRVRDGRRPEHPPTLSVGCATDLAGFCARLHRGDVVSPAVSARVVGWLSSNTDLSMVASAFGLDPLAHADEDRGLTLWNKTGTIETVRGDVGLLAGPAATCAYAVIAEWDDDADPEVRDQVLATMASIGRWLRARVTGGQ